MTGHLRKGRIRMKMRKEKDSESRKINAATATITTNNPVQTLGRFGRRSLGQP